MLNIKRSYDRVKKFRSLKRIRFSSSESLNSDGAGSSFKSIIEPINNEPMNFDFKDYGLEKELNDDINEPTNLSHFEDFHQSIDRSSTNSRSSSLTSISRSFNEDDSSLSMSSDKSKDVRNNQDMQEFENRELPRTLREKLQIWAVNNIFTLRNSAVTELLKILRTEDHEDLPKTAETLLKSTSFRKDTKIIKTMDYIHILESRML